MPFYKGRVYPHLVSALGNPNPSRSFVSGSCLWLQGRYLRSA